MRKIRTVTWTVSTSGIEDHEVYLHIAGYEDPYIVSVSFRDHPHTCLRTALALYRLRIRDDDAVSLPAGICACMHVVGSALLCRPRGLIPESGIHELVKRVNNTAIMKNHNRTKLLAQRITVVTPRK